MKIFPYLGLVLVGSILMVGVAGCKNKPKNPTPVPRLGTTPSGQNDPYGVDGIPVNLAPESTSVGETGGGNLPPTAFPPDGTRDDRDTLKEYTVYFGFDESTIRANEQYKIEYVSDYLKNHTGPMVRIEGHCDERGTEGYNLALGERRAQAIRDYLINLGNDGNRIFVVSFGESQPAALGNTSEAYAKNRRGEFVLLVP
jgi:peptidoglycan-associated lipoprotein